MSVKVRFGHVSGSRNAILWLKPFSPVCFIKLDYLVDCSWTDTKEEHPVFIYFSDETRNVNSAFLGT